MVVEVHAVEGREDTRGHGVVEALPDRAHRRQRSPKAKTGGGQFNAPRSVGKCTALHCGLSCSPYLEFSELPALRSQQWKPRL